MGRTIAYFVFICTLLVALAMLVTDTVPGRAGATLPPTERTTAASADAESRTPPRANRTVEPQSPPRTEPNMLAAITRQPLPDVVSAPWADEMEGAILDHIAQRPGLELAELQAQCHEEGCVIFLGGDDIPVYQMDFDVFASKHGFASAVIQSMDGGPNRMVFLRR